MAIPKDHINPDMDWYRSISKSTDMEVHCPYANFSSCPRYYESLSLLSSAGVTTKLNTIEDDRLIKKWKKSKFWPILAEESASTTSSNDSLRTVSKYCPEVSYDIFGFFASSLAYYADEIDRDAAHKQLSILPNISRNDSRWLFSHVTPLHFSECKYYSMIKDAKDRMQNTKDIIDLKPNWFGMGIDLRELWRRIFKKLD